MAKTKNLIYGKHPIIEALKEGKPFEKIMLQKGLGGDDVAFIRREARKTDTPIQVVPIEKLNRVTGKAHQGIIGIGAVVQYYKLDDVLMQVYDRGETPLFLLLDGVTDVRNMGAIARTALCMGVNAIIVPTTGSAKIDADTMKASAGAISKINMCRVPKLTDAISWLKLNGIKLFSTQMFADSKLDQINFTEPCAIVLGSEGEGVSGKVNDQCDQEFFIPMGGDFDSLNVSVAAGMVLYEVSRQRS